MSIQFEGSLVNYAKEEEFDVTKEVLASGA
jgi:hypothetical protein